jgi:anti-sigma regulatory factor (Ser/Thr protein kinase)
MPDTQDNDNEMQEFEKKIKVLSEAELTKKIKQWIRRIEQLVALGNKSKGRRIYNELILMIKALQQMSTPKKGEIERVSSLEEDFGQPGLEVDLTVYSLSDFNIEEIYNAPDVLFRFFTDEEKTQEVADIARHKFDSLPITEIEKINLEIVFNEAVGNAQRHGHKYNPNLPIEFRYIYRIKKIIFQITDQGSGFDYKAELERKKKAGVLEEARARYEAGGYGGLGIMLMLRCVDTIQYNAKGNQITLTKIFAEKKEM